MDETQNTIEALWSRLESSLSERSSGVVFFLRDLLSS